MSVVTQFRTVVQRHTLGKVDRALRFGDYIAHMGLNAPSERKSARAQLTRAMRKGGPLRDLVDKGLVVPDIANRQPACFATLADATDSNEGGTNVQGR
jgi:hypothetical protein